LPTGVLVGTAIIAKWTRPRGASTDYDWHLTEQLRGTLPIPFGTAVATAEAAGTPGPMCRMVIRLQCSSAAAARGWIL
jgi:hypothetical protein